MIAKSPNRATSRRQDFAVTDELHPTRFGRFAEGIALVREAYSVGWIHLLADMFLLRVPGEKSFRA